MREKIIEIIGFGIEQERAELKADEIIKLFRNSIFTRSDKIEVLSAYTNFLQKNGYIDTDATCEPPFAIDEFLKSNKI